MAVADYWIYILAECLIFLLIIGGFMLFHIKRLGKLIRQLEQRVLEQRETLLEANQHMQSLQQALDSKPDTVAKDFLAYIEQEIERTRDHHQGLNPDRDIVLDISPDAPIDRQATSLRHAFLLAEKEARHAGDEESSDWEVLQGKLSQIIAFYESELQAVPDDSDDDTVTAATVDESSESDEPAEAATEASTASTEALEKRIANLEKFKKLYFELEAKWHQVNKEADAYRQQLQALGEASDDEQLQTVLTEYIRSYESFGSLLQQQQDTEPQSSGAPRTIVVTGKDEIERLKNMAFEQHNMIVNLKKKLVDATTTEQQQLLIDELSAELDKQQRFLQEAETCTELLENELSQVMAENKSLHERLQAAAGGGADADEMQRVQQLMSDLTNEGKEMLSAIATLEKENQDLKQQLGQGGASGEDSAALQTKIQELQQELLNLQTQHIELEERYLEMKTAQ